MSSQVELAEAIEYAAGRCLEVLSERPAALLTDIDGTISLIAPTPGSAFVERAAVDALTRLTRTLDVVGTVSGRAAVDAETMVAVPGMIYIGNHGFERRAAGVTVVNPRAAEAIGAISDVLDKVQREAELANQTEGIIFENKGVTGSVHYRLASDQESARTWLIKAIGDAIESRGLRMSEGRLVIEIRPTIAINKGTAVRSIVEEHQIRGMVFLGDDITDLDGFSAIVELRAHGALRGLNVAIVSAESPPEVAAAADVVIPGVGACIQLLATLAGSLSPIGGID